MTRLLLESGIWNLEWIQIFWIVKEKTKLEFVIIYDLRIANILLDYGADYECLDRDKNTLLILCIKGNCSINSLKLLLQYPVNVNAKNTIGYSALFLAVYLKEKEKVELLLKHKADPNIKDFGKLTPVLFAAQNFDDDIVNLLLKYESDLPPGIWSSFYSKEIM